MDVGPFIIQSLWMYGLAIVIAVLAAILIRVIVVVLARRQGEAPHEAAPTPAQQAHAAQAEEAQGDIAAIAAAVYASLGMARIVRIEPGTQMSWAAQGRLLHHSSHDVHHHH